MVAIRSEMSIAYASFLALLVSPIIFFYEDVTPLEQTTAYKSMFHAPVLTRDRGTGRPTKRDRREIDDLKDDFFTTPDDKEQE